MKIKRKLDIVVISNVHLGTKKSDTKKLLNYLNSIAPKHLVLNGDIIDFSQLNQNYFGKSHLKIIKKLMKLSSDGTQITYVVGNRDKQLEKSVGKQIGNISIVNKLLLDLDGKKTWFFRNDILESTFNYSKQISQIPNVSYQLLLAVNTLKRLQLKLFRNSEHLKCRTKISKEQSIYIERILSHHAIKKGYDYVVSKLNTAPEIKEQNNEKSSTVFMNTGDWSEHYTALEYRLKRWKLYKYSKDKLIPFVIEEDLEDVNVKDLIAAIMIVKSADEQE